MSLNKWIAVVTAVLLTVPLLGVVAESTHTVDDRDEDLSAVSQAVPPQEGGGTVVFSD